MIGRRTVGFIPFLQEVAWHGKQFYPGFEFGLLIPFPKMINNTVNFCIWYFQKVGTWVWVVELKVSHAPISSSLEKFNIFKYLFKGYKICHLALLGDWHRCVFFHQLSVSAKILNIWLFSIERFDEHNLYRNQVCLVAELVVYWLPVIRVQA